MAETLAQAVLEVGVDDSRLRAGLQGVERQAAATGAEISRRFTASGREILTAANGLEYFIDALGRARRENGQFVTATERLAAGIGGPGGFGGLGGLGIGFDDLARSALNAAGAIGLFTSAWEAANFAIQQNVALDNAGAAVETLGVNAADLEGKLRSLSTELNNNISTVDLLKASYDVASSGFANAADATDVLRAAALGATGGFSDINTVADATTSVLNAYGLAASNATKLVDGFIQTQNDGKIIIGQYAQEIGRVAPVAAAAGVSIEELNAAVSVATAQGVPVGSTFAGLRQAITSILKPTSEAAELAGSLGLSFNAQALKAQGLGQFLENVAQKTGGAADALTKLFGSVEAVAAVQPLLNDELVKFNNNLDSQTSKSGQAADAANKASNTLSGSVKRLQNSLSDLVTSTNESLQPLAKFINLIAEGTKLVPSLGEGIKKNLVPALGIFDGINKNLDGIVQKLGLLPELEALKGGIQGGIAGLGQDLSRIAEEYRIALGGQAGVGPEELIRFEKELADLRDQRAKKDAQARKDASFAFQNAERDIVRPAREQLEIAQRLSGLDGERLRQARQQLDIEKLLREERKKREEFKGLGGLAAVAEGSPAAIDAAAKLEAAGINVRTEIVKGADELRRAAKEAGENLRSAQESAANAIISNLNIATEKALSGARKTLEGEIQRDLKSGLIDPSKFVSQFGGSFDSGQRITAQGGTLRQQQLRAPSVDLSSIPLETLQKAAAATGALADAQKGVAEAQKLQASTVEAQKGLQEATKELNASIQASNKRESNLSITVPVGGQKQVYLP